MTELPECKELTKILDSFADHIDKKGPIKDWTDSQLLKTRDRFRKAAVKNRGKWTFDFYEVLQNLNKESIKRNLKPDTDL